MNVLSLFDGMSCAQIALDQMGISCTYYASEIDKYAIKITKQNYPNTVHLGSIKDWQNWNLPKIDLIIAGCPCQSFSKARSQNSQGFKDPRGSLFFDMVDVLKHYQPKNWLVENVTSMGPKHRQTFDKYLGKNRAKIDSKFFSAQMRSRTYWSNFMTPNYTVQSYCNPEVLLGDILEDGCTHMTKSYCVDANYHKGTNLRHFQNHARRQLIFKDYDALIAGLGRQVGFDAVGQRVTKDIEYRDCGTRILTPIECERLQTVPEGYTNGVSNTQRYKMLGNGFTVAVIKHILGYRND